MSRRLPKRVPVVVEARSYDANLQFHKMACATCRYYREYQQRFAADSECLLRGRTLGITSTDQSGMLLEWARGRWCQFWKRRPKTWTVFTKKNPHWHDAYIGRPRLIRLRKMLGIV